MSKKLRKLQKLLVIVQELREVYRDKMSSLERWELADAIYRTLTRKEPPDPVLKESNRANRHYSNYETQPTDEAIKSPWRILAKEKNFWENDWHKED